MLFKVHWSLGRLREPSTRDRAKLKERSRSKFGHRQQPIDVMETGNPRRASQTNVNPKWEVQSRTTRSPTAPVWKPPPPPPPPSLSLQWIIQLIAERIIAVKSRITHKPTAPVTVTRNRPTHTHTHTRTRSIQRKQMPLRPQDALTNSTSSK